MNLSQLDPQSKIFLRHIEDLFELGEKTIKFSSFLNEGEQAIVLECIRQNTYQNWLLEGGFDGALRKMLCVYPKGQKPDFTAFPITAINITYPKNATLSHRDFLGGCLGLMLSREGIGDIIPDMGSCVIFVLSSIKDAILQDLKKIGRYNVSCQTITDVLVETKNEYDYIKATISSNRIDCLVGVFCGLSREKSARLIKSGLVQKNYSQVSSISAGFGAGDTITIRGYGKFLVDNIGNPTKKGRLPVDCRKFK